MINVSCNFATEKVNVVLTPKDEDGAVVSLVSSAVIEVTSGSGTFVSNGPLSFDFISDVAGDTSYRVIGDPGQGQPLLEELFTITFGPTFPTGKPAKTLNPVATVVPR